MGMFIGLCRVWSLGLKKKFGINFSKSIKNYAHQDYGGFEVPKGPC